MKGRYFKQVKKDPIAWKAVVLVGLLLMVSVVATLPAIQKTAYYSTKADPAILASIKENKVIFATICYTGHLDAPGMVTMESWHFGNLTIAYVRLPPDTAKQVLKEKNLIRMYSWEKFKLPPYKFVVKDKGVTYNFSKDYKRIYHHANDIYTGKNVTIAVIDTGVDYLHPDFFRNGHTVFKALVSALYLVNGSCLTVNVSGYNYTQMENVYKFELKILKETNGQNYPFEDVIGHGTHVCGIIAGQGVASNGRYKGIATGASLIMIKAFYDKSGYATQSSILNALEWVYDNAQKYHIKILSCSWGYYPQTNLETPTEMAMDKIVHDKHVMIFCAAGNELALPTTIISPARDPNVVAVGAVDPYTNKLAYFSSCGNPVIPPLSPPDKTKPDFVGAGVNIISCASHLVSFPPDAVIKGKDGWNYVIMSGTSMATPAVAATYACFIQYWEHTHHKMPNLHDFVEYTRKHGHVYDWLGKDFITGWGGPVVPSPSS